MEIAAAPPVFQRIAGVSVSWQGICFAPRRMQGLPMVGLTLLHRKGYFRQRLDEKGQQRRSPRSGIRKSVLEAVGAVISGCLGGKEVKVRGWRHLITGLTGRTVPVYFLDVDLPENSALGANTNGPTLRRR